MCNCRLSHILLFSVEADYSVHFQCIFALYVSLSFFPIHFNRQIQSKQTRKCHMDHHICPEDNLQLIISKKINRYVGLS